MRIVVKVGTSTLAHATGRLNIRHTEELVKVLSDLKNAGHEVILVSSGAIGMGIALLMATWEILSLLDFFQEILGLLSSGLGGLFLMGIFFPRIGGKAALTGFLSGVCVVFLVKNLTPTSFLLYGFIGLVTSVLVGLIFSYIFKEEKNLKGLCWKQLDTDNAK